VNAIDAFIQSESKELHVDSLEDVDATLLQACDDNDLLLHKPIVAKTKSLLSQKNEPSIQYNQ
jgi:hypothetical protein